MTLDELKTKLVLLGWKISRSTTNQGCDWYAWQPSNQRDGWPHCTSNENPPSFCIEPHEYKFNDGHIIRRVEFRVHGEVPGDHWLDLNLYSVNMDDCIETIPAALRILGAAWAGAHTEASHGGKP